MRSCNHGTAVGYYVVEIRVGMYECGGMYEYVYNMLKGICGM